MKRIQAGTFLGFTSKTLICNNSTAKVSVNCIKWFVICASLKMTDLISLIRIFVNVQDHKLDWDTVDTFFNSLFLNYVLLKKRGLVIVETVWSTWKPILFFHNMYIKSSFTGERYLSYQVYRIFACLHKRRRILSRDDLASWQYNARTNIS